MNTFSTAMLITALSSSLNGLAISLERISEKRKLGRPTGLWNVACAWFAFLTVIEFLFLGFGIMFS